MELEELKTAIERICSERGLRLTVEVGTDFKSWSRDATGYTPETLATALIDEAIDKGVGLIRIRHLNTIPAFDENFQPVDPRVVVSYAIGG